jgi:hypothetical protein
LLALPTNIPGGDEEAENYSSELIDALKVRTYKGGNLQKKREVSE